MGKKKTARLRGGGSPKKKIAKKNMGGMMMGPKKKMAKGGSAKKKTAKRMGGGMMGPKKKTAGMMGGGMMGPKKKMAKGGSAAKKIEETKIGLHKLEAMGMLGKLKATFNKARARKPSGRMTVDDIKRASAFVKRRKQLAGKSEKKQGYKDRKDESIAARSPKKRTKKQLRDSANESYGKFGKGTGKGVINKRGGGVARRGMGKAK